VFVDDLVRRPVAVLEQVLSFAGVSADRTAVAAAVDAHAAALSALASPPLPTPDAVNARRVAAAAVASELQTSDHLQRWPCHAFHPIFDTVTSQGQGQGGRRGLPHGPDVYAANCSDPSVTCSVKFDLVGRHQK